MNEEGFEMYMVSSRNCLSKTSINNDRSRATRTAPIVIYRSLMT